MRELDNMSTAGSMMDEVSIPTSAIGWGDAGDQMAQASEEARMEAMAGMASYIEHEAVVALTKELLAQNGYDDLKGIDLQSMTTADLMVAIQLMRAIKPDENEVVGDEGKLKIRHYVSDPYGNSKRHPSVAQAEVEIAVSYEGDLSEYEETKWFQTVKTNSPKQGQGNESVDSDIFSSDPNAFFYNESAYTNEIIASTFKALSLELGNANFFDSPSRPAGNSEISWVAELSLIGITKTGRYERIATIQWGWNYTPNGSEVNHIPISYTNSPTWFHTFALLHNYLYRGRR